MLYSKLVDVYDELSETSARLGKIEAVAKLLKGTDNDNLPRVVLLLQGKVFPSWSDEDIGVADKMVLKIVSTATGFPENEVTKKYNETGDLGLTVETLMESKRQQTLGAKHVDIEKVFENMKKLASVEGKGSQEVKVSIVKELIMHSSPKEAKYIVRTALGQLRVGVAEGVIRDAIASAFLGATEGDEKKVAVKAIEWAWFMRSDYGEVARIAKDRGMKGLRGASLEIGKPFQVLLAEKSPSLEEAMKSFENFQVEVKFDGARIQAHKDGDRVWLFTRRLENVTTQFPDIVEMVRKNVSAKKCVLEGEIMAVDPESGKPLPFQSLSQRIRRKYEIDMMVEKIPVQTNWFDIVQAEGKSLFSETFRERREILECCIREVTGRFQLSKQLTTKDIGEAEKFYQEALQAGQEGVMVKNLDALYQPGRRVAGGWLKVKPIMETLDLVIIGAQWGTGKRAGWMGSFVLGCRDEESGEFLECGMMGTGVKEKKTEDDDITFKELTEMLRSHIVSEKGNMVTIRPKIVIETAYEEIQKSPNYSSGYALRFPRMVRMRSDKSPEDADGMERVGRLYVQQKGGK